MAEMYGEWALIGYDNSNVCILISNETYIMPYMDACKIAEEKAVKLGMVCGMAISTDSVWDIIKKSAKNCNQEVLKDRGIDG